MWVFKEPGKDFYDGGRVGQNIVSRFVCSAFDVELEVVLELVRLKVATEKSSDAGLTPIWYKNVDLNTPVVASGYIWN